MMLVLQATMMIPAAMPVSQPRHTALQTMLAFIQRLESHLGPGRWPNDAACVVQATSMWEHWPQARQATHPIQRPPQLEPGLECIDLHDIIRGSLTRGDRE